MIRIATWSGPRNVSTALMRSFGERSDTVVCDEPLYAHYLQATGLPHPMAAEIMEQHECDWERVVQWLTGPLPDNPGIFYQKHMAHHFLDHISRGWVSGLQNVFLIRDPSAMLASLLKVIPGSGLIDTGLPQQVELFEQERERTGKVPAVIDSSDLLRDPRGCLGGLCESLGIEFQETMLGWESGLRPTDGCWAEAWYGNALESTGFAPYREREVHLPSEQRELEGQCQELYHRLYPHRLRTES